MPDAYLLCGPSLAGKSAACERIARVLGAAIVSADAINAQRGLPFGGEGLPEAVWAETLRLQLLQLRELGSRGRSVVVDDTLCYRWLRDRLRSEARAAGLQPHLLLLAPSREDLIARHAAASTAGGRPVLSRSRFLDHLASFEWPTEDEHPIDVSSPDSLVKWLRTMADRAEKAT
jgi:predicted kinase